MDDKKKVMLYKDQELVELVDLYDIKYESRTPKMILDAEVLYEGKHSKVVRIDYPVIDGVWTLGGKAGRCFACEEYGKKAFVRNNKYRNREKNYVAEIEFMEPYDYISRCARIFMKRGSFSSPEEIIESRIDDYDLNAIFDNREGDIFYPVLDYKDNSQEGLHRAIWSLKKYGKKQMPVIVRHKLY